MLHAVTIRPVRLSRHDSSLAVTVVYGVGYRAVCSCGWRSPTRSTFRAARLEGFTHRREGDAAGKHPGGVL